MKLILALLSILVSASAGAADNLFKMTYADSRAAFLQITEGQSKQFPFKGPDGKEYVVDYLIRPALVKKENLLIIISGTHGVEGFVGSAVQSFWLRNLKEAKVSENTGLVFVHGLNPFGFMHFRRVNENNVDMNRNFVLDPGHFKSKNLNYEKIVPFLNPTEPAEVSLISNLKFYFNALKYIYEYSMPVIRQGILQGQYEFQQGLSFGGTDYQPQKQLVDLLVDSVAAEYSRTFIIDLHTGYGRRGKLHLLAGSEKNPSSQPLKNIFGENEVDFGDQKDFYTVDGDLISYTANRIKSKYKKDALGITFEFGTLNSQRTYGSIESLHRMVLENETWFHKSVTEEAAQEIATNYKEMFAPSDPEWQKSCLEQSQRAWQKIVNVYK